MKISICILLSGFFVFFPVHLNSQHFSTVDVIAAGGISIPANPDPWALNWKWGFTGGAGLSYSFTPDISVDMQFDYYSFFFDEINFNGRLPFTMHMRDIEGNASTIIGLSASVKYAIFPLSENWSPYITGGIGFQRFYISDIYIAEHTWDGLFMYDETIPGSTSYGMFLIAGGGINITTSENRSYFLEVRYGIGFSEDDPNHFIPIRIGFRHRLF